LVKKSTSKNCSTKTIGGREGRQTVAVTRMCVKEREKRTGELELFQGKIPPSQKKLWCSSGRKIGDKRKKQLTRKAQTKNPRGGRGMTKRKREEGGASGARKGQGREDRKSNKREKKRKYLVTE